MAKTAKIVCTDKLIGDVEELVQLGVPPLPAVMAQGVDEDTFADWWKRGIDGGRGNSQYVKLRLAVMQAEARCEAILIGNVRGAARTSWQAAAWLAERRFPQRYVRRSVNADGESRGDGEPPARDPFDDIDDVENVLPLRRKE